MKFSIDTASPVPLYFQVAEAIRRAVDSRVLDTGANIGPEHRLASDFGVSVPTVRKAVDLLEADGIVVRRRGVGTYVTSSIRKKPLTVVFLGDANATSFTQPTLERLRPEPEVRQALALDGENEIWRVRRYQIVADGPVAVYDDFFVDKPSTVDLDGMNEAVSKGLAASTSFTGSHLVRHQFSTQMANVELSILLDVPHGSPITILTRTDYSWDNSSVAFAKHAFLPEHFKIETII
jgi:DNA-binding GntR family transcriptional regulator